MDARPGGIDLHNLIVRRSKDGRYRRYRGHYRGCQSRWLNQCRHEPLPAVLHLRMQGEALLRRTDGHRLQSRPMELFIQPQPPHQPLAALRKNASYGLVPNWSLFAEQVSQQVLRPWLHQEEARHRLRFHSELRQLRHRWWSSALQPATSRRPRTLGPLQGLPELHWRRQESRACSNHLLRQVSRHQRSELHRVNF